MRLTRRFCVLLGVGASAIGCGEPRHGTAQEYLLRTGGAGAGVDIGALQDLGAYTPATFDPLPGPKAAAVESGSGTAAAGSTDPAAAGASAAVKEFLTTEAQGLLAGDLSGVVKSLAPAEAAAFTDERQTAIAPTFEKYLVYRRVLVSKFGEAAGVTADRAMVGSADQWVVTPLNTTSASVGPHPFLVLLGPKTSPERVSVDQTGGGWAVTFGSTPDDAAFAAAAEYHKALQSVIDRGTDEVEAGKMTESEALDQLARAVRGEAAEPAGSSAGDSSNSNGDNP